MNYLSTSLKKLTVLMLIAFLTISVASAQDGRGGDKKDNAPCFTMVFPITYIMGDGSTISIDNKTEVRETLAKWMRTNPNYARTAPVLQYPVIIVYKDGSKVTINSQAEMAAAKADCYKKDNDKKNKDFDARKYYNEYAKKLAEKVANGEITQDEADRLLAQLKRKLAEKDNDKKKDFDARKYYDEYAKKLAEKVANGEITQDEADRLLAQLKRKLADRKDNDKKKDFDARKYYDEYAKKLAEKVANGEITQDEADRLLAQLKRKLAEKDNDNKKKDFDARKYYDEYAKKLAEKVANGEITQDEADRLLAQLKRKLAENNNNNKKKDFDARKYYDEYAKKLAEKVANGEITQDEADKLLAQLKRKLADRKDNDKKKDGDRKTPCFKMVFPLTFEMADGSSITGNNREEIAIALKAWYQANPDSRAKPTLVFPIEIVYEDGTVVTINNQEELGMAHKDCYKGDDDKDKDDKDKDDKGNEPILSINENLFSNTIAYPNPAVNSLTLTFDALEQSNCSMTIINTYGSIVYSKNIVTIKGSNTIELSVSTLSTGTYFIRINSGEEFTTIPITISK